MIFINQATMSIEAPEFTIITPFNLEESVFDGFNYHNEPLEYVRYGIGDDINPVTYHMPIAFNAYNDALKVLAPNMSIKVLSLNRIDIGGVNIKEFISFLINVNRYRIRPKESLTVEQERRFCNNMRNLLETINNHPLRAFFATDSHCGRPLEEQFIKINDAFVALPNIYIHVDECFNDADELKVLRYIDECSAFYRDRFKSAAESLITTDIQADQS